MKGRMILDISPHNRSASEFPILSGGAVGVRLSNYSNQFTANNFYPIQLKLGRMIQDISPLDHSELNFSIPFQRALWRRDS